MMPMNGRNFFACENMFFATGWIDKRSGFYGLSFVKNTGFSLFLGEIINGVKNTACN